MGMMKDFIPKPVESKPLDELTMTRIFENVILKQNEQFMILLEKIKPKETSFVDEMVKAKAAMETLGLSGKKEDALDSVHKVTNIIEAITPLVNPEAGTPKSKLEIMFEAISKFGGPLFDTLRELVEGKKLEMQYRIQQMQGGKLPEIQNQPIKQVTQQPTKEEIPVIPVLHPFISEAIEAANKNDEKYFDILKMTVYTKFGPQYIEGLINGMVTSDYIIREGAVLGLPQDNPNLKPYFEKFVEWLKKSIPVVKEILAACNKCGEQFSFDNEDDWEKDDKECENKKCDGKLELVS